MRKSVKVYYNAPQAKTKTSKRLVRAFFFLFLFAVYALGATLLLGHACPINLIFGVPCPGCGLTRAVLLVLKGDLSAAFAMHPLVYLLPVIALFALIAFLSPKFSHSRTLTVLSLFGIILFIGVYVYRMVAFFPSEEPLAFNENSLLFLLKRLIEKLLSR